MMRGHSLIVWYFFVNIMIGLVVVAGMFSIVKLHPVSPRACVDRIAAMDYSTQMT